MDGFTVPATITGLAVLALLVAEQQELRWGVWLTKPVASTGFVLAAVGVGATRTPTGSTVLVALLLCWLGDVLLILRHHKRAFLAGLVSFLLGHVAFAASFLQRGVDVTTFALAMLLVGVATALVARWLIPKVETKMQTPVAAYMLVISVMVALSVGTVAKQGGMEIVVGAVAFFLSDLSVALDRFIRPAFIHKLWGLPLYYGAQLTLAWSVRVTT
ncbi:MAG: lysoplasmalogenase [Myxococcota bacterium]